MTNELYYKKVVEVCLDIGDKRESKLKEHPRLAESYGITGLRTKHFLNSLLSSGNLKYLELGVYRGASIACAMYKNTEVKAFAVDNWMWSGIDNPQIKYELDAEGKQSTKTIPWPNVKLAAVDMISKFTPPNSVKLIEKNWVDLKKSDIPEMIDVVHIHPIPQVSKSEMTTYLNTVSQFTQPVFILVAEHHMVKAVSETIPEWVEAKGYTVTSKYIKESGSLVDTMNWGGGLGVYILIKKDVTK